MVFLGISPLPSYFNYFRLKRKGPSMVGKASMHALRTGFMLGMFLALWLACLGSMTSSPLLSNSKEFNGTSFQGNLPKNSTPTSSSSTTSSNNLPTIINLTMIITVVAIAGVISILGIPMLRTYLKLKKGGSN